ncbi:MAG: hypothetical protein J6U54_13040 [Clostridiales bacterium]|nr:hypothetical protein [Clostridiales bacterium]
MKNRRSISFITTILLSAVLLSSCGNITYPGQGKWIEEFNKTYNENTVFYSHPATYENPLDSAKRIVVTTNSKDNYYTIEKRNGELYSNYMFVHYQDEIAEYLETYYEDKFPCDRYEFVTLTANYTYPMESMSLEEFEDTTLVKTCNIALYYNDEVPSKEEVTKFIIDYAKEYKEQCRINIYVMKEGNSSLNKDSDAYFLLMDSNDEIGLLSVTHWDDRGSSTNEEIYRCRSLDSI